jgi:hypothetical protein
MRKSMTGNPEAIKTPIGRTIDKIINNFASPDGQISINQKKTPTNIAQNIFHKNDERLDLTNEKL